MIHVVLHSISSHHLDIPERVHSWTKMRLPWKNLNTTKMFSKFRKSISLHHSQNRGTLSKRETGILRLHLLIFFPQKKMVSRIFERRRILVWTRILAGIWRWWLLRECRTVSKGLWQDKVAKLKGGKNNKPGCRQAS